MSEIDRVRQGAILARRFSGGPPGGPLAFRLAQEAAEKAAAIKVLPPGREKQAHKQETALAGRTPLEKKHLLELNERCAVGVLGSTSRIIWQPDPAKPAKFLSSKDARELEATRVVNVKGEGGGTKKLKMFNEWFEWDGRRAYDEIRFAPGVNDPTLYNLFNGWGVEPRPGDWSLLHGHLQSVICGGDSDLLDWFMTWLAHTFQHPAVKIPVAVVIRGKKGTGKSIVMDFLHRLMPAHLTTIADGQRALGHFNSQLETTLVLALEEAFWAGDQAKESILKNLITGKKLRIERKGIEAYEVDSCLRVVMLSNERWVVPASHDERRYAFFDCSDQHRGDIPYFKAMAEQMENGGLAAMLYDLLHFEPENGWDILFTAPTSAGLQEQVVESLRGIDRFMFELLSSGAYECDACAEGGIFLSETQPTSVSLTDLRAAARDHMADNFHGQKQANHNLVERAAREWFDANVISRRAKHNQVRWVEFPPLSECRDYLRRTKRMDLPAPPTVH